MSSTVSVRQRRRDVRQREHAARTSQRRRSSDDDQRHSELTAAVSAVSRVNCAGLDVDTGQTPDTFDHAHYSCDDVTVSG